MLPQPIRQAVVAIARDLEEVSVPFYIGGSTMLRCAGFDVSIGDIDVVVDGTSRVAVERIFGGIEQRATRGPWRSTWLLSAQRGAGAAAVAIDVIGDLRMMIDGVPVDFPFATAQPVSVDEVTIPIGLLRHWYHLYRVHSPSKARLIADRISDDEIMLGAAELGIEQRIFPYTDSGNRE